MLEALSKPGEEGEGGGEGKSALPCQHSYLTWSQSINVLRSPLRINSVFPGC